MNEVAIYLCKPGDEQLFRHIVDGVFDHPIGTEKLSHYLRLPHHHLFIAIEKSRIVGQLTALSYGHPEKRASDLFIDDVGVAASAQRRGIATR